MSIRLVSRWFLGAVLIAAGWNIALPEASWAQSTRTPTNPVAPVPAAPAAPASPAASVSSGPEFTLADAIRTALDNNRSISIARRRIDIAQDRQTQARAGYFPSLEVDASTAQRDNQPVGKFNLGPTPTIVPQGDEYTAMTHTALVVPLLDFGKTSNASDAAKAGVDVAQLTSERTEQDIVLQVSQAYYRVLESQKIRQVVLDSIATVQLQLQDAKAFLDQGLVSASDVLSAEVRLAERQQDLITAETNLQVAQATLNRVMGQNLDKKLHLQDVTGRPEWSGNYDSLVEAAHHDRSDLKAAQLQIASSEADLRAARAAQLPTLNAYAAYDTNSTSFLVHKEWFTTGLSFSMVIFNGGAQSAKVAERQKELLEAQDQFLERQDNISLDVKQAYLSAGQAFDSVKVAEKNQELAAENLRIFRDRYTQGLVTSTDVLIAEDAASRSKSNYYQALYDYHTALARLDNVIGKSK
jgi:outer membrane protein